MRQSIGVGFYLKTPAKKVSAIKCVFNYAYKQLCYYEPKLSVPTEYWNKKTQRARTCAGYGGHMDLNATLDHIELTILSTYRRFLNEHSRVPEVEELRNAVKSKRGILKVAEPIQLFDFIERFIKMAESGRHLNMTTGLPVKEVTVKTYRQTLSLLKDFSKKRKLRLDFRDMNSDFHKDFIYFLTHEFVSPGSGTTFKPNTIGKHITNLKTFLNYAVEKKVTTNLDFKLKTFKVPKEQADTIYLNTDEIDSLESLDLSFDSSYEITRDLFIIGCFTALRISDLKRLTKHHIKKAGEDKYLEIEMKKTGRKVSIPLPKKIEQLILKYQSEGSNRLGDVHEQSANAQIKEIAELVPALRQDVMISSTVLGKRITNKIPKFKLITLHTARRSFATNKVIEGYPYSAIMLLTGHTTEKSFLRYVRLTGVDAIKIFKAHSTGRYATNSL